MFVFSAIQGYGWALLGEAEKSNSAYERAKSLIDPSLPADVKQGFLEFVAEWQARGLLKLRQPIRAREALEKLVGNPGESRKIGLLQQFGQILIDAAGYTGRPEEFEAAEAYFKRIIELDPRNATAHYFKGVALILRSQNMPQSELEERRRLRDGARTAFLQSIRLGETRAETHLAIAKTYEADGDDINADKHWERYCELRSTARDCLARPVEKLARAGDVLREQGKPAEALKSYRDGVAIVDRLGKSDPGAGWQRLSTSLSSKIGDVLHDQGELAEALKSYRESLGTIERLVKSGNRDAQLESELEHLVTMIGGLAYRFVLARDFARALEAADQAIALAPNQVWLYTNRAHALMFLGRGEEAQALYVKYRDQDKVQGDKSWTAVIREDFAELRKAGLENPLMLDIEKQLAPRG